MSRKAAKAAEVDDWEADAARELGDSKDEEEDENVDAGDDDFDEDDEGVQVKILPYLFIGDVYAARNKEELTKSGITHIVNLVSGLIFPGLRIFSIFFFIR